MIKHHSNQWQPMVMLASTLLLMVLATAVAQDKASPAKDATNPGKAAAADKPAPLTITWSKNMLIVYGEHLPGKQIKTHYLEAYCRPGSTDRVWNETVIGHKTELIQANKDKTMIQLRCTLKDGVIVDHTITAGADEIDFRVVAKNPTDKPSLAHWVQPCVRVGDFTGSNDPKMKWEYIKKSFIFLDGKLEMMPTRDWATKARYIPGQVWRPANVPADDVNPRPLNKHHPSNGLIGCFSGDNKMILGSAWEPYQELFQGVIVCVHSDFRIGGLAPGESKKIRGKLYLVPNDVKALLARYQKDFPEHVAKKKSDKAQKK
jgi:hypothetical protein